MRTSYRFMVQSSVLGIVLGASPAYAQVAGPAEAVVPAQATEAAQDCDVPAERRPAACEDDAQRRNADGSRAEAGQTVTVTGTRIRLPNLTSPEPTFTLDNRQVTERNFTNIADALNEAPGVRGSVTPAGAQGSFGQGVNFINNYGLGSNRTLTLINGRRFVTSNPATNFGNAAPGTQTDLNVIPAILLDRVDIVSVGGAPLYGSDAISGVTNIILRSRFEGAEVSALSGITEEGDNFRYNISGLVGRDFFDGRLNLTLAVARDVVEGVLLNDREYLRRNVGGIVNPSATQVAASRQPGVVDGRLNPGIGLNNNTTDFNPGVVQARNVGIPFLTNGGLITATNIACTAANANINPASCFGIASPRALFFAPNGDLLPFNQGVLSGANTSASNVGGDNSGVFLFNDFGQITSELERTTFNGFLTFEITPEIEFFLEGTHFRSRADELVQQPTFNSSLFGGLSGALTFTTNNPFLTAQARQELTARGVTIFQISRASTDIADLTGFNETRINRGVAGIRGNFEAFGRSLNFEAYANIGETRAREVGQDINAQNFVNAVNVTTNAAGQIVCTTAPTAGTGFAAGGLNPIADPNCVPFNPLGFGRASAAARDYIVEEFETRTRQQQRVYNVNLGGSLFNLTGAGDLGFNVGYEHRDEEAEFTPSEFQRLGRGRSVAIVGLEGRYNLDEVFGEIVVPLVSPEMELPFLYRAQAFGRGRYVHSTVNGGFFSWAAGATISPIRDVTFRGNFTRSFRNPSITELFLPTVNAFSTVPDICSAGTRNGGPVPAIRSANCAAFLARFPNATPDPANNATVPIQTGGNSGLQNEQANAFTLGVIVQPRFIPRLSLSADYISIDLDQPISSLSVAQVASGCFDNPDFNAADPANGNAFCSRIGRQPVGARDPQTGEDIGGRVIANPQNPAVRVGFVNGVRIEFRGIQGTINYSLPLSGIGLPGTLAMGADALHVRRRINNITGVAPARVDGTIGDPAFSAQVRLRYTQRNWGINTTINYIGEQLFSRLNREVGVAGSGPDARELDKLNDYAIVSAGVFFDATENFRFTVAVTNIGNYVGQEYFGEILPASFTDLLGRRYSASARIRF